MSPVSHRPDEFTRRIALAILTVAFLGGTFMFAQDPPKEGKPAPATDAAAAPAPAELPKPDAEGWISLFNGKDLTGWKGNPAIWRVENGYISGKVEKQDYNTFLVTEHSFSDFVLEAKVILLQGPGFTNSGIQYRSRLIDPAKWIVGGYQADMGKDWWGSLYEEKSEVGRGVLVKAPPEAEKSVKAEDWNQYVITAKGWRLKQSLNGIDTVDFEDTNEKGRRAEGVIALQYHAPGGFEVRAKDIRIKPLK